MNDWTESEDKTKQTNMPRAEVLSLVTLKYHLREASMTRITNEKYVYLWKCPKWVLMPPKLDAIVFISTCFTVPESQFKR